MDQGEFTLDDVVGFLASLDIFRSLRLPVLMEIQEEMEFIHLKGGAYLMRQGEPAEDFYIVVSGRLRYLRLREGREEILSEISRGETVGETAILTGEPYFASVQALRDSYLLKLSGSSFLRLMKSHPQTMMKITRIFVSRMRHAMESRPHGSSLSTIAVFSLLEEKGEEDFIAQLVQSLQKHGKTLLLTSSYIEGALSREYVEAPRHSSKGLILVRWFNLQESEQDFLLFQLDPRKEEWTRRSLRQADIILIVADSKSNPQVKEIEKKFLHNPAHPLRAPHQLVLLNQTKEEIPSNTHLWLENRSVDLHHHIEDKKVEDFDRLARIITGRAISLVLGGGGARGLAHIGVIRALRERGIPIDMIGGASMGAILGAEVAALWDSEKMLETTREYMRDGKGVLDYTLPLVSFLAGQRLSLSMEELAEGRHLEDLWLPYFCITSNLNTGQVDMQSRGLLWKALRATSSLPAIFPPVLLGDHWHVDGGVLNNLPTDVMRRWNPQGKMIAIDVSFHHQFIYEDQSEPALSGWYVLWRKLNPFAPQMKIPNIAQILMRSIELQSLTAGPKTLKESNVDLLLRPPVQCFGMLEFKSMSDIVETGYKYTLKYLTEKGFEASI